MKKLPGLIAASAILLLNQSLAHSNALPQNLCIKALAYKKTTFTFIDLNHCRLNDEDMNDLADFILQKKLKVGLLNLDQNNIGSKGASLLVKRLKDIKLEDLSLDDNHVGPEGAAALANLRGLYQLSLNNNDIGTEGALALAGMASLRILNVNNNKIGAEAVTVLAKNTTLQTLHIAESTLDEVSIAALSMSRSLQDLDLSYTNMSGSDLKAVFDLPQLTRLSLNGVNIGAKEVKAISELSNLRYLSLADNNIDADSVAALGLDNLYRLNELNISNNPIGDKGIMAFMKHSEFPLYYLFDLIADECNISNDGALALAKQIKAHPGTLSSLSLRYNHIGESGIKELQQNITKLKVDHNDGDQLKKHH